MSDQGGRYEQELLLRMVEATERSAKAQEDLIRLATEEREIADKTPGPPYCPHCGHFDPEIHSEGGDGPMSQFILVAECGNCRKRFFCLPEGWQVYASSDEPVAILNERAEG